MQRTNTQTQQRIAADRQRQAEQIAAQRQKAAEAAAYQKKQQEAAAYVKSHPVGNGVVQRTTPSGSPIINGSAATKTKTAPSLLDSIMTGESTAAENEARTWKARGIDTEQEKAFYQLGQLTNSRNPYIAGVTYPLTKIAANLAVPVIEAADKGIGLTEKGLGYLTGNQHLKEMSKEGLNSNLTAAMNQGIEDTVHPGKAEGLLGEMAGMIGGVIGAGAMGAPFESFGVSANIAPKIGIGLQSGVQSMNKATDEGASTADALKYGAMNGLMNAATEGIAGGIPGLGEGSLDPYIAKLPGLAQIGANMVGEGAENALQEALDPVTQRLTYNKNAQSASGKELLSAFGWGAALSGVMEGAGAMVSGLPEQESADTQIGRNLKAWSGDNLEETAQSLIETGQEYAPDTKARKAADNAADLLQRNGELTEKQLGRLWRANAETQRAEAQSYFYGKDMNPYTRTVDGQTVLPTAKEINVYELQKVRNDYARKVAAQLQQYNVRGVVVTDLPAGEEARWDNGAVYVSSKLDTASAINAKIGHEIAHASAESDAAFVDDVLRVAAESGTDVAAEAARKKTVYEKWMRDQNMTADEIAAQTSDARMREEVACDFIGKSLVDGDLAKRLTDRPKLAEKLLAAVNSLRGHSSVSQPEAARYAVLAGKLRAAVDAGGEVQAFSGAPAMARFSIDEEGNADFSEEEIRDGMQRIAAMEPVAEITGEEFAKSETGLTDQVDAYFQEVGGHVHNAQLGDVTIDRRGAKADISHGLGRKKAASFAAVPAVIEQGSVIDYQHNWENRHFDTAVVAAPITIAGEPYYAGVVLQRNERENRFYLHEVLAEKEDVPSFWTGTNPKASVPGDETPSIVNLLRRARKVKENLGEDVKHSLDEDYTKNIDEWDGVSDKTFAVGTTSEALKSIGVEDRNIVWHSDKISKILKKHSSMTMDLIKQVPNILENPVVILKSKAVSSRIVIFGDVRSEDGNPVTAILELQPTNKGGVLLDMNLINSAYVKDKKPAQFIETGDVVYLDPDIKRTNGWLQGLGLQLPSDTTALGSLGSVSYQNGIVKIEGVPFKEIVQGNGKNANWPGIKHSLTGTDSEGNELSEKQRDYFKDSVVAADEDYINGLVEDAEKRDEPVQPWEETERQAGAAGYPVLDGKQVFPFKTWVQDKERGNYGLVVGQSFDRKDGQLLTVSFWNKDQGARAKVDIPVSELQAVSGKYQPEDAELRSLFQSEPPDSLRGAVSREDYEEYRSSYDEAHGIAPGTTVEYKFEDLPPKAAGYAARAENRLVKSIAETLDVPYKDSRNELKPLARTITEEYLRTGTVSQKTVDALFGEAWDRGVKVDETFYNDNKYIKDELKNSAVSISDYDAKDIADFGDWKRRQFGRLKITKDGTPVNIRYTELSSERPDLFPEAITAPSDQLQQMATVAGQIVKAEKSLDGYYGDQAETYKEGARQDFENALNDYLPELSAIRKYYEQRAKEQSSKKAALKFAGMELDDDSVQYVRQLWKEQKTAAHELERAKARNLMTDADNEFVDRAIRREADIENIPEGLNAKGIRAIYEARQNYEEYNQQIQAFNRQRKAALRSEADSYLGDITKWKDKASGIQYARETMERNIRDIAPAGDAEGIIARYIKPVHDNEAEATRLKNSMRERVRALDLSQKVEKGNETSEAAAVQLLGEAQDNIDTLQAQLKQKGHHEDWRNGHTLQEWQDIVTDFKKKNPNLDYRKIDRAVGEFRSIYNELFEKMNDARIKNGYEPVDYRKGYFPHFQGGHPDELLSQIGKAIGIKADVSDLPTSINGITHTFKPGIQWQAAAKAREGFSTDYDAVEGFDKYLESAAGVICHTNDLQGLRALADQIRYRSSDEGIKEQIDALRDDPALTMEEREDKIRDVYDKGRTSLGNFIGDLDEYTNLLAGKRSKYDRNMEALIGRKSYNLVKSFENRVAGNMVSMNPGSWLTNFIPLTQASTGVSQKELFGGMWDTLKAYKADDGFSSVSSFLTNRRGSDPLVKTWSEKASEAMSAPMEYIDQFTADSIVRARYKHNVAQGMNEDAAMHEADAWAAGIMADRSRGSQPTIFAATNPGAKLFTQFQLEVNNQLSWMFKDLPREYQDKGKKMLAAALMKFLIGSWLYNEIYEHFVGRRPALDPVGMLNDTVGDLTGKKLPNTVDALAEMMMGGKYAFADTEKKTVAKAGTALAGNVAENLPFVGGLLGGGRLPISSALPNAGNVWNAAAGLASGEGNARKNKDTLLKELEKPAAYVLPPFGGGQLKKAIQGIKAVAQGGRYGVDSQGRDMLQYPVFNDSTGKTILNGVQAGLFGPTALPTGQAWIKSGFKSMGAEQTEVYKQLKDSGESERKSYDFVKEIGAATAEGDDSKKDAQIALLQGSKLGNVQKNIVYYGMLANDKEKAVIEELDKDGAESKDLAGTLGKLSQASKAEDKRAALIDADLSDAQKAIVYEKLISDKNPEIVKTCLSDGMSMNDYLKYAEYFEGSRDYAEKYTNMKSAGIAGTSAAEILTGLADLQPAAGDNEVTFAQKLRVIADSSLDDAGKLQAVNAALDKTTVKKMNQASGYGINVDTYTQFQETLPRFDADGNGSYKQAEVEAALDNMDLSNSERAVLWQLRTGGKNNPYDRTIGANIKAEAAADKQAAKAASGNSLLTDLFGAAAAPTGGKTSPDQFGSSGTAALPSGGTTTAEDIQKIMFG